LSFKGWVINSGNGPALNVQIIAEVASEYAHVGPAQNICGALDVNETRPFEWPREVDGVGIVIGGTANEPEADLPL